MASLLKQRPGVEAGWRVLLAFQRRWLRANPEGWQRVAGAVERRPPETVSWRFSNPGEMPEFCDPFRGRPEILVVAFRGSRRLDRPATFWQASGLRSRAFGFSPRLNRFTRF